MLKHEGFHKHKAALDQNIAKLRTVEPFNSDSLHDLKVAEAFEKARKAMVKDFRI